MADEMNAVAADPATDSPSPIIGGLDRDFNEATAAKFELVNAYGANSKVEGEMRRVAARTGVPVNVLLTDTNFAKKEDYANGINIPELLAKSPITTKFFANSSNARLAYDDVANLSALERAVRQSPSEVGNIPGPYADTGSVFKGLINDTFSSFVKGKQGIRTEFGDLIGSPDMVQDSLRLRRIQEQSDSKVTPQFESDLARDIYGGVSSTIQMIPAAAASIATGNPLTGITMMSGQVQSDAYGKYRDRGATPGAALLGSTIEGAAEGVSEILPMKFLTSGLGKLGLSEFGKLMGKELGTEIGTTIVQSLTDTLVANPDKSMREWADGLPAEIRSTVVATLVQGLIMGGANAGLLKLANENQKAIDAQNTNRTLQNIAQLAEASKVRERDPQTFNEFVTNATEDGPIQDIYINAESLNQSGLAEQVSAASPAVANQFKIALETGGDIRIPIGEYTANLAGTEYNQSLLAHLKTDPDGMTQAEAKDFMDHRAEAVKADIERILGEKQEDESFKDSARQVGDYVLGQLTNAGRYTDSVNQTQAILHKNFFAVMAAKLGVMPKDLFDEHLLRVQSQRLDSNLQFNQAEHQGTVLVEGQERQSINASGQAIARSEGALRNFWQWYSNPHARQTNLENTQDASGSSAGGILLDGRGSENVDALQRSGSVGTDPRASVKVGNVLFHGSTGPITESGQPVVFYHGTRDDITAFDLDHPNRKDKGWLGRGVYGSNSPDLGSLYAGQKRGNHGENVMPLYMAVRNPYIADASLKQTLRNATQEQIDAFTAELKQMGHDGVALEFRDGTVELVAFDRSQVKSVNNQGTFSPHDPNILYQGEALNRAAFDPSTNTISLLNHADLSSFLHESGHYFLEVQFNVAAKLLSEANAFGFESMKPGEQEIIKDTQALLDWFGVNSIAEWNGLDFEEKRSYHERFARGFEAYLFEGKSPSIELQGVFQRFRAWLVNVYKDLKNLNVELSDDVRGVFDRMLASTEEIKIAEQGREMMALFETAEQSGMPQEWFSEYQKIGIGATSDAIQDFQSRALRDMKWMHGARNREIKRLQKAVEAMRAEMRISVRQDVMSQQIYRAWQFLTAKLDDGDKIAPVERPKSDPNFLDESLDSLSVAIAKLGGLKRDQVESHWGWDKKTRSPQPVFGKPLLRRQGGLTIDAMAQALAERGYLALDEDGHVNQSDFETKFDSELRGETQYSNAVDPSVMIEPRAGDEAVLENLGAGRLNLSDIDGMNLPPETISLIKERKMTARSGIDPDVIASMFDYSSGDELVRKLAEATPPKDEIEAMTDARMLQEHGELVTHDGIQRAADAAVHNDLRARFVAAEMAALDRALNLRQDNGQKDIRGHKMTTAILPRMARDYAQALINKLKVRDVVPSQYASAEARSAKAAKLAFSKGDIEKAATHKRNQLLNNYATKAAYQAQADVADALTYFARVQKPGNIPAQHFEQIMALLAKFDLRTSVTGKAIDRTAKYRTWAKSQLDAGNIPPNVENLLTVDQRQQFERELQMRNDEGDLIYGDEDEQSLLLASYVDDVPVRHYKEVPVEELLGLRDTIKQIEHIGRRTKKVLTDRKNREFDAVVASMRDRIIQVATERGRIATDTVTPNDKAGQEKLTWRGFFFSHIKTANILHIMDGGDNGPMWEHLMMTANEAANGEVVELAEAHDKIQELLKPVKDLGKITDKEQFFPSIATSLNRQARLVMALNMGNESNQQRLLGGKGWTLEQIKPVLDTLTTADWHFIQGMWDYYESFRPRVGEMEKLINGAEPTWVEARALEVHTADNQIIKLRGGYAPVIYDPRGNGKSASFAAEKDAKQMMQAARVASTVAKSFTKARVDEVKGRPLLMSLDAMIGAVQDTVHYLNWQPWIIDANRLIKALDKPIREHYGHEIMSLLSNWAGDNAAGMRPARDAAERKVTHLAKNVSFAGLAFNVMSAAKQITGYSQSVAVVGSKWMMRGVARSMAHPRQAYLDAVEMSDFMRKRATTRMRDLAEVNQSIQDQGAVRKVLDSAGYSMMLAMQTAVDVPTWWGAYEKAIDGGENDDRAIALADQAVIDAQGSGLQKDLSSIERQQGAVRLLTGFMSFMNTTMNVNYRVLKSDQGVGGKAVDLVLVNAIPVFLAMMLGSLLTPGGEEDKDPKKLVKKYAVEQTSFIFGQMIGFRELAQLAAAAIGEPSGDYGGAVGMRLYGDIIKLAKQVGQGQFDDALRKAVVNAAGDTLRIPSAQINRTVTGAKALYEGKTHNPAALVFGFNVK